MLGKGTDRMSIPMVPPNAQMTNFWEFRPNPLQSAYLQGSASKQGFCLGNRWFA